MPTCQSPPSRMLRWRDSMIHARYLAVGWPSKKTTTSSLVSQTTLLSWGRVFPRTLVSPLGRATNGPARCVNFIAFSFPVFPSTSSFSATVVPSPGGPERRMSPINCLIFLVNPGVCSPVCSTETLNASIAPPASDTLRSTPRAGHRLCDELVEVWYTVLHIQSNNDSDDPIGSYIQSASSSSESV